MADRIHFQNNVNDSVQVGDTLYVSTLTAGVAGAVDEVGLITDIGNTWVEVADGQAPTGFVGMTEVIANGDCEGGFTNGVANGWTSVYSHTFAEETTIVHSGSASQKITAVVGNTSLYGGILNTVDLVNGVEYNISGWCYSETGDRDLRLLVRDGSNANIYVGPTATVGAGWVEFSDTFTFTSSNPTNCDVMFKVGTSTGMLDGDVYYFDDISIVPSNVSDDLLFMFRKDGRANTSTLVGYFAEVNLVQNATDRRELFGIGSEIFVSSK